MAYLKALCFAISMWCLFSLSAKADPLYCASIHELVDVKVNYWGLDQQTHTGILEVNQLVAQQVKQIFQSLYQAKFPIAKIQPLSAYQNNDAQALADNDTFAFSCRYMTGSTQYLSMHSFGLAIDINPLLNPYVKGDLILPPQGKAYLHRSSAVPGMIVNNDIVVQTFKKYGWIWGGNWKSPKDYQHFENDSFTH